MEGATRPIYWDGSAAGRFAAAAEVILIGVASMRWHEEKVASTPRAEFKMLVRVCVCVCVCVCPPLLPDGNNDH